MIVAEHAFEPAASDQLGFGLLGGGSDLFDLMETGETTVPMPAAESAVLLAMNVPVSPVHGVQAPDAEAQGSANPVELAAADPTVAKPPHADASTHAVTTHQTEVSAHIEAQHPSPVIHALHPDTVTALNLDDILIDAAQDLANFTTAAGGHQAPMGSGMFTPFDPAPILAGLTEAHLLAAA